MRLGMKGNNSLDDVESARRRMLWGFLDAFVAWQMAQILQDLFDDMSRLYSLALVVASLAGLVGFFWYGYKLLQLQQAAKQDPAVAASLDDERSREMRNASLAFAFWALLIYIGGMRLLDLVGWIPQHGPFWQLGLVVGAVAAIGHFLYTEWRDDE